MNLLETNRQDGEIGHLLESVLQITESMLASFESSDWLKVADLTEERANVIKELASAMRTRLSAGPLAGEVHVSLMQRIRERSELLSARLKSRGSELLHAMEAENNGAVHRAYAQQEHS